MTNLPTLITRLRELRQMLADLTAADAAVDAAIHAKGTFADTGYYNASIRRSSISAALAIASRNALPALLDRLERLERVAEAAKYAHDRRMDDCNCGTVYHEQDIEDIGRELQSLAQFYEETK